MKKFSLISSWFYTVRSYKRLISFKNWLLTKFVSNQNRIQPKILKTQLSDTLFRLHLNKYVWFGTNFFFSKNYGLDHQSGYLTICYKDDNLLDASNLTYIFYKRIRNLYKLLSLAATQRNWKFGPARALDLRTALVDNIRPFVSNKFVKDLFNTNKFFSVLWRNRFTRKRKFWRGFIDEKFFMTLFTKRFVKYLFYYRYFDWVTNNDLTDKLPFGTKSQFSQFYLKFVSQALAPHMLAKQASHSSSIVRTLSLKNATNFLNNVNIFSKKKGVWNLQKYTSKLDSFLFPIDLSIIQQGFSYNSLLKNRANTWSETDIVFLNITSYNDLYKSFNKSDCLNTNSIRTPMWKIVPKLLKRRKFLLLKSKLNISNFRVYKTWLFSLLRLYVLTNINKIVVSKVSLIKKLELFRKSWICFIYTILPKNLLSKKLLSEIELLFTWFIAFFFGYLKSITKSNLSNTFIRNKYSLWRFLKSKQVEFSMNSVNSLYNIYTFDLGATRSIKNWNYSKESINLSIYFWLGRISKSLLFTGTSKFKNKYFKRLVIWS